MDTGIVLLLLKTGVLTMINSTSASVKTTGNTGLEVSLCDYLMPQFTVSLSKLITAAVTR